MTKLVKNIFTVFLILILLNVNIFAASSNTKSTVAGASMLGGLIGIIPGILVGEAIQRKHNKDYGYILGPILFGSLGILGGTAIAKHYSKDGDDISTAWVFGGTWVGIIAASGLALLIVNAAMDEDSGNSAAYVVYIGCPLLVFGGARIGANIGDESKH